MAWKLVENWSETQFIFLAWIRNRMHRKEHKKTYGTYYCSWPSLYQCLKFYSSDLMMLIKNYIYSQSSQDKWVSWKRTAPNIMARVGPLNDFDMSKKNIPLLCCAKRSLGPSDNIYQIFKPIKKHGYELQQRFHTFTLQFRSCIYSRA